MNVAYLDPPYSRYFHELAKRLAGPDDKVVALLSSPAYRIYTRGDRSVVWQPGRVDTRYDVPPAFAKAEWADIDAPDFVAGFSHAVEWFKERFRDERIDTCLVFSDARPFSQAAHIAARELGVVCVFFERGAFRLRTSSLSTQGINARFDLRAAARCKSITGMTEAGLPPRRPIEHWLRSRFVTFLALNALARARCPERALMQHKRYHPFNYVRIALKQFLEEHPNLPVHHEPDPARKGGPVVLLPLQLPTDSQFVMYSPFKHNQEFIDFVVAGVRKAAPDAQVLVKVHPMDVRRYRMPRGAQLIEGSLARFYEATSFVVCLNSNAGFEAAIRGTKVVCFADSFYTRNSRGRIEKASVEDFEEVAAIAIHDRRDAGAGHALKEDVLRYYQSPGDSWAYLPEDLDAAVLIVEQHVAAGRSRIEEFPSRREPLTLPLGTLTLVNSEDEDETPFAAQRRERLTGTRA
jgi:capsular polysaccharide export protein